MILRKFTFAAATTACFAFVLNAQNASVQFANTITGEDLSTYLEVLASDEMEGRATGTPGNQKAAEYLAETVSGFGIPPVESLGSYFQDVSFTNIRASNYRLSINDSSRTILRDYLYIGSLLPGETARIASSSIVFLGWGIDDPAYTDYRKPKKVRGKTLLIYGGEPFDDDGNSLITGTPVLSDWSYDLSKKLKVAAGYGAEGVIVISTNFRQLAVYQRGALINGETVMSNMSSNDSLAPHCIISSSIVEELLGNKYEKAIKSRDKGREKGKLKPVKIPALIDASFNQSTRTTTGANVLAYIEGTDPALKDEVIVITAHYDHVGVQGNDVYNGADDNASGTSGVLEIAQAFQEAKVAGAGPRRSVLCMWVTGEEIGLLGSQYYTENPVFPLGNTVANVNIDMIGRTDNKHSSPDYIYVIGSDRLSTELHAINETANERYTQLELDYTYNAENDPNRFYYRSDHYNFARNGIPAIFFFSGVHADYHRPTDTADKIMYDKAARIARLAFHTAWELANRDARIKVDVGQ